MTIYNTENPVPSIDPKDLVDNAHTIDEYVNSPAHTAETRLGIFRRTLAGADAAFDTAQSYRQARFNSFIAASGYTGTGAGGAIEDYAAGITITEYNQIIRDSFGEFWRLSGPTELPYTTTGAGLPEGGALVSVGDAALRQELAAGDGASKVGYTPAGVGAVATDVQAKLREFVSVKDFGAVGDGVTDDTAAIQAALNYANTVIVPDGAFSCGEMIEINQSKTLILSGKTTIQRPLSAISTDPVIWVKGNHASVIGKGTSSIIRSFKDSPRGVVRLGHKDDTESHSDVLYCSLLDFSIYGQQNYGKVSGDPDVCLYMNNPQIGGRASYFHQVRNILFSAANIGIWLRNNANANTMSQLQFLRLGGNDSGVENAAIFLNGAKENMISQFFFHFSPDGNCILFDNAPTTNTELNIITNWVAEPSTGGGNAKGMVVRTIGNGNYVQGVNNGIANDYGASGTGFFGANKRNTWMGVNESLISQAITLKNQAGGIYFDATGVGGQLFSIINSGQYLRIRHGATTDILEFYAGATLRPGPTFDGLPQLGGASNRWGTIFSASGTINTSDEREKTFLTIEDSERAAALEIKANLRKFKFNSAVDTKGDDARIHFGAAAQQVSSIMKSHDLDPTKYGFFCYDEWETEMDEFGNVVKQAGNSYGIRYEELMCFLMTAV